MLISRYWCLWACPGYVPDHQLILFLRENLRSSSGTKTKELKNWKTVFSREIQEEILWIQFFSFSVLVLELFQNICRKTEKRFFFPERFSVWIQFSVFQYYCMIGQEQLYNCFLKVSSLHVIYFVYVIYRWCPLKRSSQNLEGKMCVKHCEQHCFCTKHSFIFFWGATIYIYIYKM